jgi:hypothetical protein
MVDVLGNRRASAEASGTRRKTAALREHRAGEKVGRRDHALRSWRPAVRDRTVLE